MRADQAARARVVLGLRLLALAIVAGSGLLLPLGPVARGTLALGILCGAGLGLAQSAVMRRSPLAAQGLTLGHVAIWTFVTFDTGGAGSPLFVGYLLEIALAGALFSRRGCIIAALAGAASYLAWGVVDPRPLHPGTAATVVGFIAAGAVLVWIVTGVLESQRRAIAGYERALSARAESLAESLRLLSDYLSGALLTIDDLGRVTSLNPGGAVMLGRSAEEAVGRPWQQVLEPDLETSSRITDALARGIPQRHELMTVQRPDGRTVLVRGDLWRSPSTAGRTFLLLEERVSEGAEEDPVRRLGEAVACVAHQIKNSVHALQGLIASVEPAPAGAFSSPETTSHYRAALRSLAALADDVLALAGAPRPTQETIVLHEVLASAMALNRHASVPVRVEVAPEEMTIRGNRGQVLHALFNLLDNACLASAPGQPVRVRAHRHGGQVHVQILDSGPGIAPRLAQARGPVPSAHGSGFGLVAARRFIEANGGKLQFLTPEGGGTCCQVELPSPAI